MKRIVVPMQTTTPVFLGGWNPKEESAELRPPSFKGALRFWLRALLGSHHGDRDIGALRREEATIFGGVEPGAAGSRSSPVIVRVGRLSAPRTPFSPRGPGSSYLMFSMGERIRQRPGGPATLRWRSSIPADAGFDLSLVTGASAGDQVALRAAAALWLLTRLGAVGARARRGAGAFRARTDPEGWPAGMPPLAVHARSTVELTREIEQGLDRVRAATGLTSAERPVGLSSFDVLHPRCCDVYVAAPARPWRTFEQALEAIGGAFQSFRHLLQPDYDNVKAVVGGRGGVLQPVMRSAFGLPIMFYFRSLQGARGVLAGGTHDRRASPLMLKVERLANGDYTLVVVLFRAALLQANEPLSLQPRGRAAYASPPGFEIVDEFLAAIQKRNGRQFVAELLPVSIGKPGPGAGR